MYLFLSYISYHTKGLFIWAYLLGVDEIKPLRFGERVLEGETSVIDLEIAGGGIRYKLLFL